MTMNENELHFTSKTQFLSLKKHFEKVTDLQSDDKFEDIRLQISKLLDGLRFSFEVNAKKTMKIFELQAELSNAKTKDKITDFYPKEYINNLKENIKDLSNSLYRLTEKYGQTEKQTIDKTATLEKASRVNFLPMMETGPPQLQNGNDKVKSSVESLNGDEDVGHTDEVRNMLENNLKILTADLMLCQEEINELKDEIVQKNKVIKEYREELSESQLRILKAERQYASLKRPIEDLRKDSNAKQEIIEAIETDLDDIREEYSKLRKCIELELAIRNVNEENTSLQKVIVFEGHLAKSRATIKNLKKKIVVLEEQIFRYKSEEKMKSLIQLIKETEISEEQTEIIEEEQRKELDALEKKLDQKINKLGENREKIIEANKKCREISKELSTVIQNENEELKAEISGKNEEIKYLKENLSLLGKEMGELKVELKMQVGRFQEVVKKITYLEHLKIIQE